MPASLNIKAERIACGVSFVLALAKAVFAIWTGALSLFASALDSLMDFFVSGINLFSLKVADRPADADHAFGHGKAEALAALFQSIVIIISAFYLLYSCLARFFGGVTPRHIEGGALILLLSLPVSYYLTRLLRSTAKRTQSVVLQTDALHYAMDLFTNCGILISFIMIRLTGWGWLDPLVTLPIALYIAALSLRLGKRAVDELMDRDISPEIRASVEKILERHAPLVVNMHNFKSRRAGAKRFLQLHLDMKKDLTFLEVHELEEQIAGEIRRELGNVQVMIHADPEGHGLDQTDLM